jgi:hypothetical protein
LAPGDGIFPLTDFVRALPSDAALSVEVPYVRGRGELVDARALNADGARLLNA